MPCCVEPDSGPAWIQNRDGNGNNICVCVCVADRAGEPAGSVGSGPVGVPQPLCRNPPTALQQDGGQVLIGVGSAVIKITQLTSINVDTQTFFC